MKNRVLAADALLLVTALVWGAAFVPQRTAISSPLRIWSVRAYTETPPLASGCQPATRIGRMPARGATP